MNLQEFARYDGIGLADLVRRREVRPIELAELVAKGVEATNPALNAVIELFDDVPARLRAEDPPPGPFAGVPTLTKDFTAEKGRTVEFGSELTRGYTARVEMAFWRRMREAGILNLGRTTSSEFGLAATTENRLNGITCNPWDTTRGVAGSSGGAAAVTAAGAVPFAHGGDGGGSIRNPAAYCGLVGLKPTRGRVSSAPFSVAPLSGMATNFVLTRTVRDTAALLDVMEGPEPGDYFEIARPDRPFATVLDRPPGRLRIAFTTESWSGYPLDGEIVAATRQVAQVLADLGHRVIEASPSFDYADYLEAQKVLWCAHEARSIAGLAALTGRTLGPDTLQSTTWAVVQRGRELSADAFIGAIETYEAVTRRFGAFFQEHDILLTPTAPTLPEPVGTYPPDVPEADVETLFDQLAPKETYTAVFNATGQPAISLPLAQSAGGLPIGLQFAARFGAEADLLGLAAELEQALPWRDRRPAVHVAHAAAVQA